MKGSCIVHNMIYLVRMLVVRCIQNRKYCIWYDMIKTKRTTSVLYYWHEMNFEQQKKCPDSYISDNVWLFYVQSVSTSLVASRLRKFILHKTSRTHLQYKLSPGITEDRRWEEVLRVGKCSGAQERIFKKSWYFFSNFTKLESASS